MVFAHVPLWTVYPQVGLGHGRRRARRSALLKRFGSVTVLNGHIHQALQKIEGNITFHTARSTAFPQPEPGTAPKPGPMVVAGAEAALVPRADERFVCGKSSRRSPSSIRRWRAS